MKKNLFLLIVLTSVTVWGMGSSSIQMKTTKTDQKESGANISIQKTEKKIESKSKYTAEQIRSMAGEASSHKR